MKIILKKDVLGLGYKDEVLTVKDGYGRNYLLPQGLAVLATEKAVKQLNEELKQRAHKIAKMKADAEAQAKKFEGVSLSIKAKVSEGKNIYGSVGPKEIAAALAEKGLEIDSKLITLKGVKALGNYEAVAHFHREVSVTIPFEVVNEEGEKAPAKKEAPKAAPAPEAPAAEEEAPAAEPAEEAAE
ncbi:MAG: 50S ribosomal protein L9 [Bacteroidaceae bacterium]|nr:50S ribosomal protein L9 [Bacteroidaceae bacterium]MBR1519609.1 50S ribosomal protein L9 [Bacteroidaceae bacterium]